MKRPLLDPADIAEAEVGASIERLPARVRAFGYYPSFDALQPGDLILVRSVAETMNVRAIESAQQRRHDAFDAQWTHATAYLGDRSLVEIDQGGVSADDLHKYVGHHRLLFRRCLDEAGTPISAETGYRVAVAALKMFKTRYDRLSLLDIARQALSPRTDYRLHPRLHAAAICSDYFNDAVVRVLGRGAASAKLNPFTPADISASSNMVDVPTRWTRLP